MQPMLRVVLKIVLFKILDYLHDVDTLEILNNPLLIVVEITTTMR
jgi:hypothetical protein